VAELANEAAGLAANGRGAEAKAKVARMRTLRGFAMGAAKKAGDRAQVDRELQRYEGYLGSIQAAAPGAPSPAPAKAAKQEAFDNINATF
jgi:hypothetical protein